jgi:hypothetical protein
VAWTKLALEWHDFFYSWELCNSQITYYVCWAELLVLADDWDILKYCERNYNIVSWLVATYYDVLYCTMVLCCLHTPFDFCFCAWWLMVL